MRVYFDGDCTYFEAEVSTLGVGVGVVVFGVGGFAADVVVAAAVCSDMISLT